MSSQNGNNSTSNWRKKQLEQLETKFQKQQQDTVVLDIQSESELQPMWKEMEGRVTRRKARTIQDTGGKSGRMNIRTTDEDIWQREGLYNNDSNSDEKSSTDSKQEQEKDS